MISVTAAKQLIREHVPVMEAQKVLLAKAAEHTLAVDIYPLQDIPAFEQSSMDGYAIRFEDRHELLTIIGEMQAGTSHQLNIMTGQATRIFTGAPLPAGADTVVMQEKTIVNNGILTVLDELLFKGANVRSKGAEAKKDRLAMQKDSKLTPAALGFLAGIGFAEVEIYPSPRVGIIVTGKELQDPGKKLTFGQVYESNSYALTAALKQIQVNRINLYQADDQLDELTTVLQSALDQNDMVLLTGGVSVGDYDFVLRAAERCGIDQIFHKVKQKPGKPLYFGKKNDKVIFGLPGNPASVLNCFYNYVLVALELMSNKKSGIQTVQAPLALPVNKPGGLTQFLKGSYQDGKAIPLNAQESFRLSSFAQANCLICLEEQRNAYEAGDIVEVFLLPGEY